MDRISEIFERWENQLEMPEYEEIWFMFEQIKQISAERDLLVLNDIPYLVETIKKVSAERDAAIADLNSIRQMTQRKCFVCKYADTDFGDVRSICDGCGYNDHNNWQRRGLPDSTAEAK